MTQRASRTQLLNAIGLVHQPADGPSTDRYWARGLVVRHARDQRLRLVDILELDEDGLRNGYVLTRLAALAAQSDVAALVTYGVQLDVADHLADDLGVRHLPVPHTDRPRAGE
jgi:hypothetical protein